VSNAQAANRKTAAMPLSAGQFEIESQVLVRYRAAESSARQMLRAARQADWDRVSDCEARFRRLSQQPAAAAGIDDRLPADRMSAAAHRERLRAIRRLILIDAEVRRLCDPQAAKLDAMLSI